MWTDAGIYKITCTKTGKFYIGSSVRIKRRWHEHKKELKRGGHHSQRLQHAWSKYGGQLFKFEVIKWVNYDKSLGYEQNTKILTDIEQGYLDRLRPWDRNIGLNILHNAKGGAPKTITDDVVANILFMDDFGVSVKDMSVSIGCDPSTICRALKANGRSRSTKLSEGKREEIVILFNTMQSSTKVAKEMGVSASLVRRVLHSRGIDSQIKRNRARVMKMLRSSLYGMAQSVKRYKHHSMVGHIENMLRDDVPTKEIYTSLGIKKGDLFRIMRKHGLKSNDTLKREYIDSIKPLAAQMFREGCTYPEVQAEFNISNGCCTNIKRECGLL